MNWLIASPVLVPLATSMATALLVNQRRAQQIVSLLGAAALLAVGCALVLAVNDGAVLRSAFGNWPEPFAIAFHIDRLSAVLILITGLMALASLIFAQSDADPGRDQPLLLPLVHGVLAGVAGAFATADLFNLYVWFEVMLIAALGVLALGGRRDQLDGTFKYLTLNLIGTLLLLIAVGSIYGATGHLNYTALAEAAGSLSAPLSVLLLSVLVLSLLFKAGAFPLFAWLPASYHTLPAPVLALFAGLLTKVGVYAVLRILGDVFAPVPVVLTEALGWIAALTMLLGVLGAAYHWDIRRILAFHIISQIGYILLAVALASAAGNAATLFYTVHHIVVKANLFLIGAIIWRLTGSYDLRLSGGLYAAKPLLGVLFLIPALSLVGIPPLSGFWAKFMILDEAIAQDRVAWTFIALLVSVLTLYSMMKIWMEAFWRPHPNPNWQPPRNTRLAPAWIATWGLAAVTLWISFNPEPLAAFAKAAAATLAGR